MPKVAVAVVLPSEQSTKLSYCESTSLSSVERRRTWDSSIGTLFAASNQMSSLLRSLLALGMASTLSWKASVRTARRCTRSPIVLPHEPHGPDIPIVIKGTLDSGMYHDDLLKLYPYDVLRQGYKNEGVPLLTYCKY